MERQDEQFNKWIAFCENIEEFSPIKVIGLVEMKSYVSGSAQSLTPEELEHIQKRRLDLEIAVKNYKLVHELAAEVDLNVSKIYTDDGVKRYLLYLKNKIDSLQYSVKSQLQIEFIKDMYLKWGVEYEDPFFAPPARNEIYNYLTACSDTFDLFTGFTEYISYLLAPNKEANTKVSNIGTSDIDMNSLESDTHKLLLLHKLGLFEPLLRQHYNSQVPGMFTKLIGTLIGVQKINNFRPQLSKFITGFDKMVPDAEYKKVITPTAERKVNAFLAEIGLI